MSDLQQEVTKWANVTFGESTPKSKILHLWEEIQEAHEKSLSQECDEEIADCALIVMHLASSLSIELPELTGSLADDVYEKFLVCKKRNWGTANENGVVHHTKD